MTEERSPLRLDDDQAQVTQHVAGPLMCLGGPGTGKTITLQERFVELARAFGPDRVLFLVPNRAQKMDVQDRLTRRLLVDEGMKALVDVPVYTWHGFAYHLVSRHYDRLAYPEPPVLLTSPEQWGDVRDALAQEDPVNWPHHRHLLRNRGFVDEVVDFCIRAEQRLLDNAQLEALAAMRPAWADVVRFFKAHRARLRARSRVDYPTLLADAAELVANHDEVRERLHRRFLHVLVDEGQELALVQQRLLHFLTMSSDSQVRSLVVAGDPDSAIETFRGADPNWIDGFEKEFGPYKRIVLTTSYRLGPHLGEASAGLIERNGEADHRPTRFAGTATVELKRFPSLAAEVEAIAREIRYLHLSQGVPYEEMAIVLTSPRAMLPPLERALDELEVPFSISAPDRPLGREPIVRAFADLASFAFGDTEGSEDFTSLLRSPLIDLEDETVRSLERAARVAGIRLEQVVAQPPGGIAASELAKLDELLELTDLLRAKADAPADEAFWVVWDRSRVCGELQERARRSLDDPAHRDLDALVAFSRALGRFVERRRGRGTFREYLDAIGRADFGSDPWLPPERSGGGVNVLSFHGAKGKQWAIVAVAGVVEGSIPKGRRATGLFDPYFLDESDPTKRSRRNEMEDRRVFYVATTRAAQRCIVTTSPGPSRRGVPSRFIAELGAEPEIETLVPLPPLTFAEAAAAHRRTLADTEAPAGARIAALAAIGSICERDPGCRAATPAEWWWRWDWTEGGVPIRAQQSGERDELPADKLRTSYSRISTYDNCGLQYLFSVVLGLDPESSHNMAFGSVVHKVFESIENDKLEPAAAYKLYDELFARIASEFPNRAVARQFYRDGQLMIERYGTYLKPGSAAMVESQFEVWLEGHKITGRIDRVDNVNGNLVISDYKTSRHPMGWDEAKESLQLAIYHLAARSDPSLKELGTPSSMQLVYPGAPLTKGSVTKRCQTPEEAETAITRLPDLIRGVLSEDFRPDPEADCTWCKFKPLCPLWSEGKELPA